MFGSKKNNLFEDRKDSERSLISETVSIDGTVNSSGAIDINGLIRGPVYSQEIVIKETEICKDSMCLIKEIQTSKEEILECKDGYDGPNYWELFAQFYYSGITVPAYCRPYARPSHPFKTPGMVCLNEKGVWSKQ